MLSVIFIFFLNLLPRGYDKTINLNLYGNMGFVNPVDINAKLNDASNGFVNLGTGFETGVAEISNSYNFGASLGYQFMYRFNLSLFFDYMYMSSISSYDDSNGFSVIIDQSNVNNVTYYEFSQGASAYSLGLMGSYSVYDNKRILIDINAGILYSFSMNYYEDIFYQTSGGQDVSLLSDASSSSIGFLFGASLNYSITRKLSVGFDAKYRLLNFSSLTGSDGYEYPFTYPSGVEDSTAPMSVDFSGFYLGLSIRYDFPLNISTSSYDKQRGMQSDDYSFDENKFEEEFESGKFRTSSSSELTELKNKAREKYLEAIDKKDLKAQNIYNRLFDIISKLQKGAWDNLSKEEKDDKLDKIYKILK